MEIQKIRPDPALLDLVESYWMLAGDPALEKEIVILPDGRIDVILEQHPTDDFAGSC